VSLIDIDEVCVDAEAEWEFGKVEVHVYVNGLALGGFKGSIGRLETKTWGRAEHAFGDGGGERVGYYVFENEGGVNNGVLLSGKGS
jgi:hypothetical protein